MEQSMTAEENFIVAIISQAIVDTTYVGEVKDKVKFKMDAIDWIVGLHPEFVNYCKILAMDTDTIRNKILANLDIAERRLPQDGKISYTANDDTEVDFRISILPTSLGERVVIRILNSSSLAVSISAIGFTKNQEKEFITAVSAPQGMVLVTGPTGSGKTSIISILNRLYPYQAGQILLDDIDIKKYDLIKLRKFIGIVQQEPVIFKRSIRENINYGKLKGTYKEVFDAASTAKISHLLQKDDNNHHVSGGEKQRIAIARAIIRNPRIILLDEATAALDRKTEKEIQESLDQLVENRTSIVIAHR